MPASRTNLIVGVIAVIAIAITFYHSQATGYRSFHGRQASYYSKLARACESLLKQHPGFTRHSETSAVPFHMTWIDSEEVVWEQARLSPADPSMPEIIRTLRPDEVLLALKRVFLGFGVGRDAWSIIWEESTSHTNTWTLYTNAEGLVNEVYLERSRRPTLDLE